MAAVEPALDERTGAHPLEPVFERSPLTVVTRIPELCEPAAIVGFVVALSARPEAEGADVVATIEPPTSPGACALVLSPNLSDYVGVIPGARLRSAPPAAHHEGLTARTSGDALVIGRVRALDELATLPPIVQWAAMDHLVAAVPDAWAHGIARFDVATPIFGHAFEPKIQHATFAIEDSAFLLGASGEQEVLDTIDAQLRAELDRIAALGGPARVRAVAAGDPVAGLLVALGLANAVAEGRVHFESSADTLQIRLDIERADETKAAVLLGIVSALFGPAISKYHRRMQTAEPRLALARMYDGIAASMYEDPKQPSTFRGCPILGREIGWTPALDVPCSRGPGGRCTIGGAGPAAYSGLQWTSAEWKALGFAVAEAHRFHYNFRAKQLPEGCQFTAQAFGDLDDDGLFSTFERAGAANRVGIHSLGIYIDQEVE